MTTVLGLDIASTTGWCFGAPGETPSCGSVRFASPGASHGAILARAFDWMVELTKDKRPDIIVLEDLLPFGAARGRTNKKTGDLLGALHGIVRLVAFKRSIFKVQAVSVSDVRGHFIDGRTYKSDQAKSYVLQKCKSLGWLDHADNDAADACAVWSFWCSKLDPKEALRVSPLFNRMVV